MSFKLKSFVVFLKILSAEIFFKEGPGSLQSSFGSDRKYWSEEMKNKLSLMGVARFPHQLLPMKS